MPGFVRVARASDIAPGHALLVEVSGKRIAVFNIDGQFFALDNTCTHRGGPLAEGEVSGHEVTCPWHGAKFDVRTGNVVGPPARQAVARYNTRVSGPDVEVEV
jgi:nitrite reductase/ring-hydroxylating ferredoxin subunit